MTALRPHTVTMPGALFAWLLLASTSLHAQDPSLIDVERARAAYHGFLELAAADDPRRADALRRLADLELERAEVLLSTDGLGAESDEASAEAIRLYEELLLAYPDRPNGDVVLYQLARAYDQRGESDAAASVLARLVSTWPDSALLDEAWFRQGEVYFLRRDFDQAGDAYGQVIAIGDASPFYDQALYKRGWSLFREARYEEGLGAFWALVARMLEQDGAYVAAAEDELSRAARELLNDTLRAMSVSFSYLEGVESLNGFVARQGGARGYEHLLYAGLGDLYFDQERFNDAAATYDAFSVAHPKHREAARLQLKVIETYQSAGFTDEVLAAKAAFAERYALTTPFWQHHDPASQTDVVDALKAHLTDLTEYHHALAQAAERDAVDAQADFEAATYWYRKWLESFPADAQTPGKRFLLAELLFEYEAFESATTEYEGTAYAYGTHAQASEAGYAALLAYDAHAALLVQDTSARAAWRRQGVDSALRFATTFPQHEQAVAVLTRAGEDLFAFDEYEAASEAALRVTEWQPAPDPVLARTAWTVIGHSQFALGDFLQSEYAYRELLALQPAEDVRVQIVDALAASVYRQAEQHRDAGDLESAVEDFTRVALVAPDTTIAATADYDAAAALVQLGQWERAASALLVFRQRYPGHELADEVTRNLAAAYLATGDAASAASELETVARTGAESMAVRIDAAWTAARQYQAASDWRGAVRLYTYLVEDLPVMLDERVDAQEQVAAIHSRRGDTPEELAALQRLIDIDRGAGGATSPRSRSAAAGAALRLADEQRLVFEQVQLIQPLAESLQRKQRAMTRALDAYGLAADYGVAAVSTASAYQIADLYLTLGNALMDSERPAGLDELALEQYELLLEEQAFPFEEQGIDLHVSNTNRVVDGVYDEWVQASFSRLAELVPARYAKAEKGEALVTYLE
jgi:tetratricopeptide (TPR) repeat protein